MQYLEEKSRLDALLDDNYQTFEPQLATDNVDSSGRIKIAFNSGLAGPSFIEDLNKGLTTTGTVLDPYGEDS